MLLGKKQQQDEVINLLCEVFLFSVHLTINLRNNQTLCKGSQDKLESEVAPYVFPEFRKSRPKACLPGDITLWASETAPCSALTLNSRGSTSFVQRHQ